MIVDCYLIFMLLSTCACDLHIPTKFHSNPTTPAQLWRHIDFSRWLPWSLKSYSGCVFSDGTRLIYLNPRLSNYYFRFSKTNGCHIIILLPVYNLTNTSLWHAALINTAKFRRRLTNHAKVISIYRKSSMASAGLGFTCSYPWSRVPNLKFVASTIPEIWRESQIVGHVTPSRPFDLILHIFR